MYIAFFFFLCYTNISFRCIRIHRELLIWLRKNSDCVLPFLFFYLHTLLTTQIRYVNMYIVRRVLYVEGEWKNKRKSVRRKEKEICY